MLLGLGEQPVGMSKPGKGVVAGFWNTSQCITCGQKAPHRCFRVHHEGTGIPSQLPSSLSGPCGSQQPWSTESGLWGAPVVRASCGSNSIPLVFSLGEDKATSCYSIARQLSVTRETTLSPSAPLLWGERKPPKSSAGIVLRTEEQLILMWALRQARK